MRTMRSSVVYQSKFRMEYMTFRRVLMIIFEIFLRGYLRNNRIVDILGSGRGIAYCLGGAIWKLW